jgi:hypothetical protein
LLLLLLLDFSSVPASSTIGLYRKETTGSNYRLRELPTYAWMPTYLCVNGPETSRNRPTDLCVAKWWKYTGFRTLDRPRIFACYSACSQVSFARAWVRVRTAARIRDRKFPRPSNYALRAPWCDSGVNPLRNSSRSQDGGKAHDGAGLECTARPYQTLAITPGHHDPFRGHHTKRPKSYAKRCGHRSELNSALKGDRTW